jgi:hypothetical protein
MIREEVGEMYGDWGVGKMGGASATGVQGINHSDLFALSSSIDGLRTDYLQIPSEISLPRNINSHNPVSPRLIPPRLVRAHVHVSRPRRDGTRY